MPLGLWERAAPTRVQADGGSVLPAQEAATVTAHWVTTDYPWGWQSVALERRVWQGHYGEAVVRAMACAAGLVPTKRDLDVEGVDYNISYPGRLQGRRFPAIDVQVKSWSNPKIVDGMLAYPLDRKNYDNLVGRVGVDFPMSRLLMIVVVPDSADDYINVHDNAIHLHHRVYWTSIMHYDVLPATENTSSKTIYVPLENHVEPANLVDLLCRDYDTEAVS